MNNDVIKKLQIKNGKLQVQIERLKLDKEEYYLDYLELHDRIDKAIEYIKTFIEIDEETGTYSMSYTFDGANLYHLLKILKGVDNE